MIRAARHRMTESAEHGMTESAKHGIIAFRVDANEKIATGHLMRCMAIALALKEAGSECVFYLAECLDGQEKYTKRLEEHHLRYRILNSRWDELEAELPRMKEVLEMDCPDWLVVDSYQATSAYLKALEAWVPVFYLDDIGQERYPVSAVLRYNDWLEDDAYSRRYLGTGTAVLNGMRYAPLRKEFYPAKKSRTKRIMVTTGGTDYYNISGKLWRILKEKSTFSDYSVHIVVGSLNQNKAELEALAEGGGSLFLHYDVKNMGDLMRGCDYAVSAGGTTLFELCACQLPTVCFSFAENQREFAESMGRKGIMIYAGDARFGAEETLERIWKGLLRLISEDSLAEAMAERMGRLVDGRGPERIADFLLGGSERKCLDEL